MAKATRKSATAELRTPGSKIKPERVQPRLAEVPGWTLAPGGGAITRTYQLPSFRAAIAFVGYVAELAEAADHHPDIDVRYRRVSLALATHSAGGLTDKDFDLARAIDQR